RLNQNGHVYEKDTELLYCPTDKRFLVDRYVEGTCPFCGYEAARGDQCDNCGRTLDGLDLINPRCRLDESVPEVRKSRHLFLRLSEFNEPLREWLSSKDGLLRKPVMQWSLGMVNEGLQDRAITRDIDWGIPVPIEGYREKKIYVWIEAVMGYLSAAIEWAQNTGQPEAWRDWWQNPDARAYYFIGKDNIPFHTLIWPAILMGANDVYGEPLQLPYDVPANQYVNFKGGKASTSRGTAPFLPAFLERYEADTIRYYLAATMPELQDSSFDEADLIRRNNDELVATWGNLAHRVLTFTGRNFEDRVPEPGELREGDRALIDGGSEMVRQVGAEIGLCRFRAGLQTALAYAQRVNQYLDEEAPWKAIKEDRQAAARSLFVALQGINALKTAFYPYVPFSSEVLHGYLGFHGSVQEAGWEAGGVPEGQKLAAPQPLFKKLDAAELLETAEA
ncbi:MAG TPA: methionine--tRNA ligase, partial [Dehalococcoidia bacterium]|nr:methionine--tRNA ligase [Dehalococcoidia bacterium]